LFQADPLGDFDLIVALLAVYGHPQVD
jgi:hypothetical protein